MSYTRRALPPALIALAVFLGPMAAAARTQVSGGVQAPSAPLAGGTEYGVAAQSVVPQRPVVQELSVPSSMTAGRPPRVALQIDEVGVRSVEVRVTVVDLSTRRAAISVAIGWVPTGRTVTVGWPRGARLRPGSYQVTLTARDHSGGMLLRRA